MSFFNAVSGTIPQQIYSLTALEQLNLNSNRLTGTLSDSVGNFNSLQLLQLYKNLMTGTIPMTLGNVQSLVISEFYNNTNKATSCAVNRAQAGGVQAQGDCLGILDEQCHLALTSDFFYVLKNLYQITTIKGQ